MFKPNVIIRYQRIPFVFLLFTLFPFILFFFILSLHWVQFHLFFNGYFFMKKRDITTFIKYLIVKTYFFETWNIVTHFFVHIFLLDFYHTHTDMFLVQLNARSIVNAIFFWVFFEFVMIYFFMWIRFLDTVNVMFMNV